MDDNITCAVCALSSSLAGAESFEVMAKSRKVSGREEAAGLSYQELLYAEGMVGKAEHEKWRVEASRLLKAEEIRECTFSPRISATSRHIVREARATAPEGSPILARVDQV